MLTHEFGQHEEEVNDMLGPAANSALSTASCKARVDDGVVLLRLGFVLHFGPVTLYFLGFVYPALLSHSKLGLLQCTL